jgi:pimeloyl-ACP methyl ester carboxylesterase
MPRTRKLLLLSSCLLTLSACSREPATPVADERIEVPGAPVGGTVAAADGVPIAYEVRGEGPTTVAFVHCWGCNSEFWRNQVEPVQQAGFRVVTLDLPGHGRSGSTRDSWSVTSLAADVQAVLDAVGATRVVLVGHSMGGPVSLALAARNPSRVQGIVCVDTLHDAEFRMPQDMVKGLADRMQTDYRAGIEQFVPQMFPSNADPQIVRWVVDQAVASDHAATIALMRDFPKLDMSALFSSAKVPIRCINAAPVEGRGMPTAIESNRKYADFDAVLMENVGHYPQLERPEEFNRKLLETLARLDRR